MDAHTHTAASQQCMVHPQPHGEGKMRGMGTMGRWRGTRGNTFNSGEGCQKTPSRYAPLPISCHITTNTTAPAMLPYDLPHTPALQVPACRVDHWWNMERGQTGMTMREAGMPDDIFCHYYLVLNDVINCPPCLWGRDFCV